MSFDVFVSYSEADEEIALSVEAVLLRNKIKPWLYKNRNTIGDRWPSKLKEAIRSCNTLLAIVSPNSNESTWVNKELDIARQYNRRIAAMLLGPEALTRGSVSELLKSERYAGHHRIETREYPDKDDLNSVLGPLALRIREHADNIPHNIRKKRKRESFVGRNKELQKLKTLLNKDEQVLITGMSGVGKTQLAIEFAERYLKLFKGGVFVKYWAEENFGEELKRFAEKRLNMDIPPHIREEDKVRYIWDHWARVGDVLVIINDPDESELGTVLPTRNSCFKVIVCSHMKRALDLTELPLGCLTESQGLELLIDLLGETRINQETSAAQDIVKWAGGLPVAIDAVGRFLQRDKGETLIRYRNNLNHHGINHDAFQRDPGKTREKTLRVAFDIQYSRLGESGRNLAWTLGQLAFSPVFKEMFKAMHEEIAWQDLLHWNFLESTGPHLYQVCHGRHHEYLRQVSNEKESILHHALSIVSQAWAGEIREHPSPTQTKIHLRVHLENLSTSNRGWLTIEQRISMIDSVSLSYEAQGLHRKVEEVCERALKLLQQADSKEGKDKTQSFELRIANAERSQGSYFSARSRLINLLEDPTSTVVRSLEFKILTALGDVYRLTGQHEHSAATYTLALRNASKADRCHAIYRLARIERLLGNHQRAFELYKKAAKGMSEMASGSSHYGFALFGIAEAARLMHDFRLAEDTYEQALRLFRQVLHPEGEAYALWGTGEVHRWLGRPKQALSDHRRSEEICLEIGDRRSQAWAIMGVAEVFRTTGRADQALTEFERAHEVLTQGRRDTDCEPTEVSLALLGIAASKRLLDRATSTDYQYSLDDYRKRNMAYYEVQCLVELALVSRNNPRLFSRHLNKATAICIAKKYVVELDEIAAIRLDPKAMFVHQLNPT